jgi:hypothetical protein
MYGALEEMIHQTGALMFFLPPYSPHLNPIELGFGLLKRWIQKHANLAFSHNPVEILKVAMIECTKDPSNLYDHCGYSQLGLRRDVFLQH